MSLSSWLRSWKSPRARTSSGRPRHRAATRLAIEQLEDRTLLTAGALDPTFGLGGKVTTDFGSRDDGAAGAVVQPDGKIVAVGWSLQPGTNYDFALARYLGDAEAPGLVVTTTADAADPYDFQTSLREAIAYANTFPSGRPLP